MGAKRMDQTGVVDHQTLKNQLTHLWRCRSGVFQCYESSKICGIDARNFLILIKVIFSKALYNE